ncbi:MAG TPA: hypothetical protein VFU15_15585 [Bacteroidia bacterium]|nr:hypothetical protein [Bacteroidia bacterium]
MLNSTLSGVILAAVIGLLLLLLVMVSRRLNNVKPGWYILAFMIVGIAVAVVYMSNTHKVYVVTGDDYSATGVNVKNYVLWGEDLDYAMKDGKTLHAKVRGSSSAVINETFLPMIVVEQIYSNSSFGASPESYEVGRDSITVVPVSSIGYMPGESFPKSVSADAGTSSKSEWGLRIR